MALGYDPTGTDLLRDNPKKIGCGAKLRTQREFQKSFGGRLAQIRAMPSLRAKNPRGERERVYALSLQGRVAQFRLLAPIKLLDATW